MLLKDCKIQFTKAHTLTGIDVDKQYDLLSIENNAYGVICDDNVLLYVPKNKYGEKVYIQKEGGNVENQNNEELKEALAEMKKDIGLIKADITRLKKKDK